MLAARGEATNANNGQLHLSREKRRRRRLALASPLCVLAMGLAGAGAAHAQDEGTAGFDPPPATTPAEVPGKPPDASVDARGAIDAANSHPKIKELRERIGPISATPNAKPGQWEITYAAGGENVALVLVDARSGEVVEAWTGDQVAWPMARGYSGQFGHILNAPYIWIPLSAIFLFGLFDLRRPGRIAHLDLLVLLSFGLSHIFFNNAEIGLSVPLAYPPLAYLLARMIWIGFKGGGQGLRPTAPITWLLIAMVFLCGFRIALNLSDSGVIDVGYAGVIGADRIVSGEPLYGEGAFPAENRTGDTYGPINYVAYVPFELALPWSGSWDSLPAAHAAAIFFDLAAVGGLLLLGRRLRPGQPGRDLGVILAFAWAAYPYTAFVLQSNSNDSLIGALLIWAMVAFSSVWGRAVLLALASAVKFSPLFLVPLFATGTRGLLGRSSSGERQGSGRRFPGIDLPREAGLRIAYFAAVFVALIALILVYPAIDPGLATAWDRTLGSQLERESPFSIWGQVDSLQPLQDLTLLATAAFATSLALVPRDRTLLQVAALSAAVMIAVQLTLEHWFYAYIPWFFGLLIAALAAPGDADSERDSAGLESQSPSIGAQTSHR